MCLHKHQPQGRFPPRVRARSHPWPQCWQSHARRSDSFQAHKRAVGLTPQWPARAGSWRPACCSWRQGEAPGAVLRAATLPQGGPPSGACIFRRRRRPTHRPPRLPAHPLCSALGEDAPPGADVLVAAAAAPGGTVADRYPFVALVASKDAPLCVGSLVAPRAVLTAASCTVGYQKPELVYVGMFNTFLDEFRWGQSGLVNWGTDRRAAAAAASRCAVSSPLPSGCRPPLGVPTPPPSPAPQAPPRLRDAVGGARGAPPRLLTGRPAPEQPGAAGAAPAEPPPARHAGPG